ncbi:MFS transporter [Solimonas flava]|uniref:MFS transporter n=1 Tax=Solimonas flava TaxID=415849 RepID=UPI000427FA53|nr:glycoside-pentoside-hexuronide (GPH):cation symporter [Solimonas flava]
MPQPPPASARARHRLPLRERLGFAIGDFGLNLYWQGLGLFLIFFYTDVLGIPVAWAGLSFFVASLWDCVSDPLMGVVADRVRGRLGNYRSFLLYGSVPLALAFALAFSGPALPLPWLVAYTLVTHIVVRTLYTAVAIPYSSLSVAITEDSDERTALTGLRMQLAFLGGAAVAYLLPSLAAAFGAGPGAYTAAAMLIGVLATASFVACFATVHERPRAAVSAAHARTFVPDALAFLRVVRASPPLLRLLAGKFVISLTLTLHTRTLVYFFKYVLGAEALIPYAVPLLTAVSVVSAPLWVWIIRRTSKRAGWLFGSVATALFALPLALPAPLPLPLSIALLTAVAISMTSHAVCFWAMLPDTVEYNEWRFGRRDEAKVFGIASFTQKIAIGLSALLLGQLFDASGFVANQAQQAGALQAIRGSIALIPAAGALLSMVALWGYRLDRQAHRDIVRALLERRAAG